MVFSLISSARSNSIIDFVDHPAFIIFRSPFLTCLRLGLLLRCQERSRSPISVGPSTRLPLGERRSAAHWTTCRRKWWKTEVTTRKSIIGPSEFSCTSSSLAVRPLKRRTNRSVEAFESLFAWLVEWVLQYCASPWWRRVACYSLKPFVTLGYVP